MSNLLRPQPDSGPRSIRLTPPDNLKIHVKTLGTKLSFDVPVSNVSRSGLLLEWSNIKYTLPFIENTLVELELTTDIRGEQRRLCILGKVTRKFGEEDSSRYGIKLIHSGEQDQFEWMNIVTAMEKVSFRNGAT